MDENIRKLRVGIFLVLAILILGILIMVNSEGFSSQYEIIARPENAPGVTKGTPIRKNGILIGRVKDVLLLDDEIGGVELRLGINSDYVVYENEFCRIGTESLLGDAGIEFLTLGKGDRGARMQPGEVVSDVIIQKNPMEIMTSFADLKEPLNEMLETFDVAGKSIGSASQEVELLSKDVRAAFQDEDSDFKRLMADLRKASQTADTTFQSMDDTFGRLNELLSTPMLEESRDKVLVAIPKILQEVATTIGDTRAVIQKYGTLPDRLNKKLDDLDPLTSRLKDEGPAIVTKAKTSLDKIDEVLADIKKVTEKFGESKGTVAKLMQDDEIYETLRETMQNVRDLTVRLGPVMNDIRIFTDSIARDPRQLGVKGAIDRRPGKSGYKGQLGAEWIE